MASVNPQLLRAIRLHVPKKYQPLLLATALVESGGNPYGKPGDSGRSWGAYQEYDLGRGKGLTPKQRQDPVGSTKRAWREFSSLAGRFSGPELAYRAQRPADRADYLKKIAAALPQAQQLLGSAPGAAPGVPPAPGAPGAEDIQQVAGSLDAKRLMMLLRNQRGRSLRGLMPAPGFEREVAKVVQAALPRAQVHAAGVNVGTQAASAAQTITGVPGGLTMGGGPSAHHSRALGNWQSDDAYDLMGKAGQAVYAPIAGKVVKISGQPGGKPGFAGYGITVRTPQGDLFFKHLGSKKVKVGQRLKPGQLIGTLEASTAGGPHLHLGGTNRGFLDQLAKMYTRK
jgi:murein DD-endopeptidase MepM/ murein hydrolase activator NlpD